MPLDELHKKKRKKNLTVLALILGWSLMIAAIAMVKMGGGH
ncbi:MAG TPA: hypothetical protein VGD95_04790 [Micavibrio sp.]